MGDVNLLRSAMNRILENPAQHDQNSWISRKYDEAGGMCGTTMCLAGHVAAVAKAEMPPVLDPKWDGDWYLNADGEYVHPDDLWDEEGQYQGMEVAVWAAEKLGLNYDETEYLFYYFGGTQGLAHRVENVIKAWDNGERFSIDDGPCSCGCADYDDEDDE